MPAVPGVINNGVISKWLSSKPSVTEMLTVDADGNVGRQAIPSAPALAWGNITGTLSAQADLQLALDGKASFVHGHAIGDVTNLSSTLTAIDIALAALDAAKLNTSAFTFANLGSKPTTLSGYGITDAQPVNANLTEIAALTTQPYGRSLLTQADAGATRTTLGLGSLATQNGTISDYLLSATAASTYLPLTGGTLTGGLSGTSLTLSGIATINGGNQNAAGIQLGGSTVFGPYGLSNGWTFVQASAAQMRFSGGGIVIQSGKTFAWGNAFTDTGTTQLWEDASHVVAQRNGANAQTWRLYGNYVDASNYRRLYITSTTGGAFTLGVDGLGSGVNGNQLRILQPITTGTSGAVGAIGGISYALSVQNNAATSWIEILNSGGINKGAFFGLDGNNFQQWNYQGGDIQFFTSGVASAGTERLRITNQGNVGIGSQTPTAALVIRRSGSSSPEIRFEDGDVTTPFTNSGFSPALDPNTIGVWGFSAAASGGISFSGFTNNTAAAYPLVFAGYQGHASPVNPAVQFAGWKTNGTNGATTLASTELIAGFYNGTVAGTPVVTIAASGAIATSGSIGIGGVSALGASHPINLPVYTWINWAGTAYLTADPGIGLRLNNCALQNLTWLGFGSSNDLKAERDAANIWGQRNGANSQTWRLYNTFTDTGNYIRQTQSFTTFSSTVHAQWLAEGLGTGAVNIPMVISPRGTGAFILGPMPDGTSTGGNARGLYAIDLQLLRSAATQVVGDYGTGIGTQVTVSGGSGSVGIGRNVSVTDSLGGSVGIGRNVTLTAYRSVGIGSGITSTADAVAIGAAANASHAYATCVGLNTVSRWAGAVNWKGFFNTGSTAFLVNHLITGVQWGSASVRTVNNTPTILDTSITTASIGSRQRHRGALVYAKFTVCGIRSDGAINKYERRVAIKDLSNLDGTASTLSVLSVDTIGTDITEISGVSVTIGVDSASKSLRVSVTGEPSYAVTGVAATNILTAVGHPFANNDIVSFTALSGGAGLATNVNGTYFEPMYKVINVSGNDFQLATPGSGSTPIDFTTDISSGTICRPIVWSTEGADFHIAAGAY